MSGPRDYYNENDPFAAQWLREMIGLGVIPPGVVDDRSIKDVTAHDLEGFRHCHFFAGIGGWAYAGRLAEWPDDLPLWTGSCPCQPFSTAGQGRGHDDPRDLWPHFFRLIRARRPARVVGEQVAGKAGLGWLDRVRADLAREGYAGRGVDIPACAVDAPILRQRLWWVALAGADGDRSGWWAGEPAGHLSARTTAGWSQSVHRLTHGDAPRRFSAWRNAVAILGDDGRRRRAQPGVPLLAHGVRARVPKWRGFGNAINPVLATEILGALLDVTPGREPVRMAL
jgi:DNA (cytosine-5)-methyltransferase 1